MATARFAFARARSPRPDLSVADAPRRRRGPRPAAAAIAVAAAALATLGPALQTQAAPQLTLSQVQSRINALNSQVEKITEAYDAAHVKLTALQRQQGIAKSQLARETHLLSVADHKMAATAQAAYRSGGFSNYVLGAATDPQSFLDQSTILDAVSRVQSEQFASTAAAGHAVKVAKAQYDAQAAAVRKNLSTISTQKAHIETLLAQSRHLLASLRAADRARLAAQQRQTVTTAVAQRASYHGPATGQAAAAVKFAYAQLGKPYVYGAAGPSSYDCSGLTMAAWGAAGVSLPHNAAMQQSMLHSVSSGSLQPGDLVFFGSPAYHVAIYIGGGRIIQAPHTGDVVKITPLSYMPDYSGAGRP